MKQRGFSGTGRPYDRHKLTFFHRQINLIQRLNSVVAAAVYLAQSLTS